MGLYMPLRTKEKSFATGINFYKLFWVFFIGSILGVVLETIWCMITLYKFQNRSGLIYGPFNLVYGFGNVIVTVSLYWLRKKRDLWIFLGGMLVGGGYEYLCSLTQQVIFGTISWDYSGMPFNIGGRINLTYCFFWGILSLMWVKHLYPLMSKFIEKIPNKFGVILTWILVVFMIFNTAISAAAVSRQSQRHLGVSAATSFEMFLDKHYPDEFLQKIYPNMIYVQKK